MSFDGHEHQAIQCANCQTIQDAIEMLENDGCITCGEPLCLLCGCTEQRACDPHCAWLRPFVCSSHIAELLRRVEFHFGADVRRHIATQILGGPSHAHT